MSRSRVPCPLPTEVYAEMSAENPDFARVDKSLKDFREGLGEWMTLSGPVREEPRR